MSMPGMPGMDMSGKPMAPMPGMLTPSQMTALRAAHGAEFDRLFLTGMIQHHNGALIMVKDLFSTPGAGQDADLFNFATDADNTQRAEIKSCRIMLENEKYTDKLLKSSPNYRPMILTSTENLALRLAGTAPRPHSPPSVCSVALAHAQAKLPAEAPTTPSRRQAAATDELDEFAPKPRPAAAPRHDRLHAPTTPAYTLKPGMYDAGEAAMGMKHLGFLKKPEPFRLDATITRRSRRSTRPSVTSSASATPTKIPAAQARHRAARLRQLRLRLPGQPSLPGQLLPASASTTSQTPQGLELLTTLVCPGGQGDVSVYGHLLFMSVEMPNGRSTAAPRASRPTHRKPPPATKKSASPSPPPAPTASAASASSTSPTSRIPSR